MNIRAVDVHRVDLVARTAFSFRLKDQFVSVKRKIRLGILAAERLLLNIREVLLAGYCELCSLRISVNYKDEEQNKGKSHIHRSYYGPAANAPGSARAALPVGVFHRFLK